MISIWENETFFAPQDIIIAGSGFVGLWSAFYLKKKHPKAKITILERGLIPTGASSRNAGFACFGSLSELMYDIKKMGVDTTMGLVQMRYDGLKKIQKHFGKGAIDFELSGGYELFSMREGISKEKIKEDIQYLNSLVKNVTSSKHTYKLVDKELAMFGFGGMQHLVKNKSEGALHSGKLLQQLLLTVQGMGVQVLNNMEIKGFENLGASIEVRTDNNLVFKAGQLLVCTNAFAKSLLPEEDIIPARGQVLVTSPIDHLPWKGTFHFDEGFYYFRNLGNRVLLGGARNKDFDGEQTFAMDTTDTIQNELERFLAEVILPEQKHTYTIQHRWSGIMGMGTEKSPIIKQVVPNVFCAVRMSGMGVALAPVAAKQIADMMG